MLELDALEVHFPVERDGRTRILKAVDGVSLSVCRGTALGLVGESGSGKTTVGKAAIRLIAATGGAIRLDGRDLGALDRQGQRWLRRTAQIIFQDPHSALNPRMTVARSVAEPLLLHTSLRGSALEKRVADLFRLVGLPEQFLFRYPHELSGGQKQRVCIARAIALSPRMLVLDEPTSALDVSVQAQILEFLKQLRERNGLTYLFISHNLAVVRAVCTEIAVMYLGRIVEHGPTERVFTRPRHPYTRALLAAVPVPAATQPARVAGVQGEIPSPIDPPLGCGFFSRCPVREEGVCNAPKLPPWQHAEGSSVLCHHPPA